MLYKHNKIIYKNNYKIPNINMINKYKLMKFKISKKLLQKIKLIYYNNKILNIKNKLMRI